MQDPFAQTAPAADPFAQQVPPSAAPAADPFAQQAQVPPHAPPSAAPAQQFTAGFQMPAAPAAPPAAGVPTFHGDDMFSTATTAFVGIADMVGRLVIVHPQRVEELTSKTPQQGGKNTYDAVFCNIVVLSGDKTDLVPDVPGQYDEVMISSGLCVRQLKPKLSNSAQPLLLGVVNAQPSRFNPRNMSYAFAEPTPEMVAYARPHAQQYMTRWQASQKSADPFGV